VGLRANGAAVGYAGLSSCGSIWACPVCNSKISAVRRLELSVALFVALSRGSVAFGAYTTRHGSWDPLDTTWRALSGLWDAVATDKGVRTCRADLAHGGIIRAAEVTHGVHGWHPHLHPLHVFDRELDPGDVAQLHAEQWRAWSSAAARRGLSAPLLVGQDLHLVTPEGAAADLADYFAKSTYDGAESVAWEATSTQTKSSRRAHGRTPWDLLRAVYEDGDADALALWHTWERDSKGKRALTWSRGLRARLTLDAEVSDEDVAAAVVGTRHDEGLVLTDWSPIRDNPRLGGALLSAVGAGDWDSGRRFCDTHAIPYREAAP